MTRFEDENQEIEMSEFANSLATDILLDYGHLFIVMPLYKPSEVNKVADGYDGVIVTEMERV